MITKQSLLNGEHGPFQYTMCKKQWGWLSPNTEMICVCEHERWQSYTCHCTYGCNTCDMQYSCVNCGELSTSQYAVPTWGIKRRIT